MIFCVVQQLSAYPAKLLSIQADYGSNPSQFINVYTYQWIICFSVLVADVTLVTASGG